MIGSHAALALALAALALTACDRAATRDGDARQSSSALRSAGSAPAAPAVGAPAAPALVPIDATRPNRVLDAALFANPQTRAAYAAAKQYAHVLEGVYCHCHCRENIGHRALVECFESDHGAQCDICQTEALVAARMTAEGRSVGDIQRAIDAYYAEG